MIKPITEIAEKLNIEDIELYGNYKAKINNVTCNKNGKLILVTSTSPTPYGEGKTTISIGLHDSLCNLGKNSLAVLREPSLGPVFGIKGGATGGGKAKIIPEDDINLHFTGDIHAVTACNNLLCSIIDSSIYFKNELNIDIDKVLINRVMDINDRSLRNINIESKYERNEHFSITTASEIMAILCLSNDLADLKNNLSNMLIAFTNDNNPVFVKDLKCVDALTILLKDAIKPNLVQTLENNPVLIHGGPFANIAHGCNSIIATKLALSLSDYVITEAGFGSDLGALKFMDIKCRKANIKPNLIIINTTIKALKYNGNDKLELGISNLQAHIDNMKKLHSNILVVLNKFDLDLERDILFIKEYVEKQNIPFSICDSYSNGSNGSLILANKVIELCENDFEFKYLYDVNIDIKSKINIICKDFYKVKNVIYSDLVNEKIKVFEQNNLTNLPICIAKTQYSISDNPKLLGNPENYDINVTDINVCNGAGFIVVYLGDIMTMPGLSRNSNYLNMNIDNDGNISGLF